MAQDDSTISRDDPEYETKLLAHIYHQLGFIGDDLSLNDRRKSAESLLKNMLFFSPRQFSKDSVLFDYKGKTDDFIKLFENDGLSRKSYLSACIKWPQLFYQTPKTLANNLKTMMKNFESDGLDSKTYLATCIKSPQLFYRSAETLTNNVDGLVEIFRNDGLDRKTYLSVCLKQPSLFTQNPQTIADNVKGFVEIFKRDGLENKTYLPACIKMPQLFAQSPLTLSNNVNGVVEVFQDDGLNHKDYLKACLKQPSLLTQSPKTIVRHIQYMKAMVDMGILLKQNNLNDNYANLFKNLFTNPHLFCLADENYIMRLDYGCRNYKSVSTFELMRETKSDLQQQYRQNFDNDFSLEIVLPELKAQLQSRNLWPE